MKVIAYFLILLGMGYIISCSGEAERYAYSKDGVRIAFSEKGKGKPALIFIHGWANNRNIWSDQLEHFSKTHQTITIDLAGSGDSGHDRSDWNIQAFGEDISAVIKSRKLDEVVLVGFSLGAAPAIEAALLMPDQVIGVIAVDMFKDPDLKFPDEMIRVMDSIYMDLVNNLSNEKLTALGFYRTNHEEHFNRILEMYPEGVSKTGWKESLNGFFTWNNQSLTTSLEKLKAPLVLINTDLEPTRSEAFKRYAPGTEVKIIPGVGHLMFWDDPEQFNALIEAYSAKFEAQ